MANSLSYARGPQFMGRKLVRKNELLQPGGLLSFPRTGCALRAPQSYHQGRESGNPATRLHQRQVPTNALTNIPSVSATCPVIRVGSDGRCNTIWYKAVFKGGVYETRETVWTFSGAEERRVASLEGRTDVA